jgi:capsular exopolysaccharide synthesis family protein
MSRLYDALTKTSFDVSNSRVLRPTGSPAGALPSRTPVHVIPQVEPLGMEETNEAGDSLEIYPSPELRLMAFEDPNGIGAEKIRALVARLNHIREERELRSLQVTSSVVNEGKTVVATNLAVTLAKYSGARTLLVEGDLHRPTLAVRLGLGDLHGLSDWWTSRNKDLTHFIYRLKGMPLWILPAGKAYEQPSHLLQSTRFADSFGQLATQFEWVIVDSTPMLPVVDANLWSALVDGTLLVVRENMASVRALKRGLQSMDRPNLVGVVVNETVPLVHGRGVERYYAATSPVQKQSE